jgi:hypothetical protein
MGRIFFGEGPVRTGSSLQGLAFWAKSIDRIRPFFVNREINRTFIE